MPYGVDETIWRRLPLDDQLAIQATTLGVPIPPIGGYAPPLPATTAYVAPTNASATSAAPSPATATPPASLKATTVNVKVSAAKKNAEEVAHTLAVKEGRVQTIARGKTSVGKHDNRQYVDAQTSDARRRLPVPDAKTRTFVRPDPDVASRAAADAQARHPHAEPIGNLARTRQASRKHSPAPLTQVRALAVISSQTVARRGWAPPAENEDHPAAGRHLASGMSGADYLHGMPVPTRARLGEVKLSSGVSNSVPFHAETGLGEVSGHLRAEAQLEWRGGRGKTTVSLDPSSHSISVDQGPLSITDSGRLADRLLQGLRNPKDAVSGRRVTHPVGVELALGRDLKVGNTNDVKITTRVKPEGMHEVVSVDASTEFVVKNVPGYGQISLTYSLAADATVDRRKKQRQRSEAPFPNYVPEAAVVMLLIALAALSRRRLSP